MPTFNCCENHSVTFVREEPANFFKETPLGKGKKGYHKVPLLPVKQQPVTQVLPVLVSSWNRPFS